MAKAIETEEQKRKREAVEEIAKNIASLAKAVNSLLNGQLKKRAIITLLAASSGINKGQVEAVIGALEDLEKDWLNK